MELTNCNIEIRIEKILITYPDGTRQRIKDYDLKYNVATGFFWCQTDAGLIYKSKTGCTVSDSSNERISITVPDDNDDINIANALHNAVNNLP
jgi:hypothetical protein